MKSSLAKIIFFLAVEGAGVIGALAADVAVKVVVNGVLASQLVQFSLLKITSKFNSSKTLTIKKSKKKQEAA